MPQGGQAVGLRKRKERDSRLEQFAEKLVSTSQACLSATATEIVTRIEREEWTATGVLEAYISRAIVAQKETNAVTEVLFTQALEEAKHLDAEFARTKKLKGPLHGVPVSFKDVYEIAGCDACIGFSTWCNKPSTSDSQLVSIIRDAGGIPFIKTNVPQTLLSWESSNPVFGRTNNPWSSSYIPGGSSGGEAALLACDGSALGFGNDIGGSLRIPALFSGIYSLKPGSGRISVQGTVGPVKGFVGLDSVTGPMGRSVEDIDRACRLIFGKSSSASDPVAPVPYRSVELPQRLKFGYYLSDGCVKPSPANQRAVLETVRALESAGHECTEIKPTNFVDVLPIFLGITAADGYSTLLSHLGPDPRERSLFLVVLGPMLPGFVRSFLAWTLKNVLGDTYFGNLMANARPRSVAEFWKSVAKKEEFDKQFYEQIWDKYNFDGLIAPGFTTPALPHGATKTLTPLAASTAIFNIVDSPVGIVPVTRVDPKLDALTEEWFAGPGRGSKLLEKELYGDGVSSKGGVYDPVAMQGLPVGVQIVGKCWEEEKVLAMMKTVDDALGSRGFGPGTWAPPSK